MYNWQDSFAFGEAEEKRVLAIMSIIKPELEFKPTGGKDQPDGECKFGGVEIKSYSTWYYKPCIELKVCNTNKKSLWVTDTSIKLLIVNHSGWLHLYNCDKLRYHVNEGEEFPIFYAEVSQGKDGYYKRMKFINLRDRSTIETHVEKEEYGDKDNLRWDCSQIHINNPYITSLNIEGINL